MPFYYGKRSAGICVVLGPKKSSTYSSEYASGFFEPAASHLPAAPLPRNEGLLRQTPGRMLKKAASGMCDTRETYLVKRRSFPDSFGRFTFHVSRFTNGKDGLFPQRWVLA
jgi:hypothetical protein